ncbi:hypothetical protein [Cytobacillus gottheilii]|nr:hypothetical protein [Cytobacillus gottheilii]
MIEKTKELIGKLLTVIENFWEVINNLQTLIETPSNPASTL